MWRLIAQPQRRTVWQRGNATISIFMATVVWKGVAIPIAWTVLTKKGATNYDEKVELMKKVVKLLGKRRILGVLADREFIGYQWFRWLHQQELGLYIRVRGKDNMEVPDPEDEWGEEMLLPIERFADSLEMGEEKVAEEPATIYGIKVYLAAAKNQDDPMIIATNRDPQKAIKIYRERWSIETFFKNCKSQGFNRTGGPD